MEANTSIERTSQRPLRALSAAAHVERYVNEIMTEYLIKVERDSVCMGDDCDAPHSFSFKVSCKNTLSDVFEHLERKQYLASVAGKNHSWEAIIENSSVAFFKGNNQQPEPAAALAEKVSSYASDSMLNIRFKYNSAAS